MNLYLNAGVFVSKRKITLFCAAMAVGAAGLALLTPFECKAAPNIVLWDTGSRLGEELQPKERSNWKAVPSDLFSLEANPPKASSDPGYYGREYDFKGDGVVENRHFVAVFWAAKGRIVIFSKGQAGDVESASTKKVAEIYPIQATDGSATITGLDVQWNADDQVALEVRFSIQGAPAITGVFAFDKTGIIAVKPGENMRQLRLVTPIDYGVAPSFGGDDLVFDPTTEGAANSLFIPVENVFLGLVEGEESELLMTWPKGNQKLKLELAPEARGNRQIRSIDFDTGGQGFYLAALSAPGIWHKEALGPSFLEKDVALKWKRPFPAKWKTQLSEQGVRATYAFRESKGQIWRGVPGFYDYPVHFEGDEAIFHLSKKVPPQGTAVIYFLEGRDTPASISTPVDLIEATLGRAAADEIVDLAGRKLRTHHRRGAEGVRRACTCGCTEAIQSVFETGEEVARRDYIQGAIEDMIYFVHRHVERIDKYRGFARDLEKYIDAQEKTSPELKPYLDSVAEIVAQIPREYTVQKENMKSFAYADELARQTTALTQKKDPGNLKAYMDLLKAWRDMGGAQDYVLAQCHTITRKICQEAGYGCVHQPEAVAVAKEIRARCRECLRNPDGYEIWPDY